MRLSMPRRGLLGLWAVAALLLITGLAAARPVARQDTSTGTAAPDSAEYTEALAGFAADPDAASPAPPQTAGEAVRSAWSEVRTPRYQRVVSLLGLVVLLVAAWALSVDRRMVPWCVVIWGLAIQCVFGLFILRITIGETI